MARHYLSPPLVLDVRVPAVPGTASPDGDRVGPSRTAPRAYGQQRTRPERSIPVVCAPSRAPDRYSKENPVRRTFLAAAVAPLAAL